ncbi:hypothetical protein ES695_07965 [Candidatus Atribacteria bacterium 1244-E10-H5-B2]|nr:MAG: hypothetical protein ES695_07965 [Candidatus Atribacteria bacterium 1244-E10-H5-B2]
MKIKSIHILLAIIIIIGGGILLASELDLYNTTRVKSPRKTVEGFYDVSDIRGSHTLEEIEKYYQLPASSVIKAFGLRPDTNSKIFQLKDMKEIFKPVELEEEEYVVETDTVKVFASLYLKIPYVSDETFYLPGKTVDYLIENDKLTGEEKEYWQGHTFKLEYLDSKYLTASEFFKVVVEEAEGFKVTGKTTVQELLDGGITEEKFEEISGFKVPEDKSVLVRDFVIDKGLEFGEIKDKFAK